MHVYHRNMPHWRQDGATYFVTFRLGDSVPRGRLLEWQYQRRAWREAHGLTPDLPDEEMQRRYQLIPEVERDQFERRMARALLVELDQCHGRCCLRRPECADTVAAALRHFDGVRGQCGDFVVMPNHVHWLVMPWPGSDLEQWVGSVKLFSAVRVNRLIGEAGALWQRESHDRLVRDDRELRRIRDYIRGNPRQARLREGGFILYQAAWLAEP